MRVEWDMSDFSLPPAKITQAFEPIAIKFSMDFRIAFSDKRTRVAIFVSKYLHCLYDLLLRSAEGEIEADIAAVISNHQKAEAVAAFFDVPFHHVPVGSESKAEAEREQKRIVAESGADVLVLARYMQILSEEFVGGFENRIINIHHSFLPAFVGARPYHQAFERGVKVIGATSHYVTADLDQGPIIDQDVVRISHRDSVPDLVQKGRNLEKLVLSRSVQLHLEHRILVFRNKTIVFD